MPNLFFNCVNPCTGNQTVDIKNLEAAAQKIADFMQFDPDKAKAKLAEFVGKINKILVFLNAAKILFAADKQTVALIDSSITVLQAAELTLEMVKDLGGQLQTFTPPKNIQEVGTLISEIHDTSLSVQSYSKQFKSMGVDVHLDDAQFNTLNDTLGKIQTAQKLWVSLNSATLPDPAPAPAPATGNQATSPSLVVT